VCGATMVVIISNKIKCWGGGGGGGGGVPRAVACFIDHPDNRKQQEAAKDDPRELRVDEAAKLRADEAAKL
jgi:hypothetical protein